MDSSARDLLVSESRELLAAMEKALLQLELESGSTDIVDAAFRAAHTIKGAAGMFDLRLITGFTQVLESVLDLVRSGKLQVEPEFVSLLLSCCDYLRLLVDAIEQEAEQTDPDPDLRQSLLGSLGDLLGDAGSGRGLARRDPPLTAAEQGGHWHFSLRFGPDLLRDGMDPLSLISYLRDLGTISYIYTRTDGIPSADELDPERCYLAFELGLRSAADRGTLEHAFDFVRADSQIAILAPQSGVAEYIQIIRSMPGSSRKLGELLVDSGALSRAALESALAAQAAQKPGANPRLGEILVAEHLVAAPVVAAALGKQRQGADRRGAEQRIIKVDASKLDQLISLIGELVIASEGARLTAAQSRQIEVVEAMGRVVPIIEQVRDRALDMRMLAIGEVFQRFPRVVRDVAKELGKEIELMISGAESELDKSMVDKLFDPLVHIVRNSIDHGIEALAERAACGKRPQGRLRLHAYHESGCIVIEITDDGRGLQRDRILAKGIERGLVSAQAELSDDEIYQLIFAPGFSTAQAVTGLSGRGVGMDVVKRSVEQLRGEIELASRPGKGTRLRIRLPLTLAIIDAFQVGVGETTYVIPLESVVECVSMTTASSGSQTLLSLRGEPLPYIRLREVFGLEPFQGTRESLIVVSHGPRRIGVVVDRLLGDMQAVIKPLGQLFRGSKTVTSSTILGDGTVALVLDVPTLVARASDTISGASAQPQLQLH
jgi:two-component system chemotaxis sensor kinase CheA